MRGEVPIQVLLVDGQPAIRKGVRCQLECDGRAYVVAEAADLASACRLAEETLPDVAVVGLRLATGDGIGVIRHLRERSPKTRVLVLSDGDPGQITEAILAGAHGAVREEAAVVEMVRAVSSRPALPDNIATQMVGELHWLQQLTSREQEVLRLIARGCDNPEIADELRIALRTVNRHLENIRTKLGRRRRSELIRLARDLWPTEGSGVQRLTGQPPAVPHAGEETHVVPRQQDSYTTRKGIEVPPRSWRRGL